MTVIAVDLAAKYSAAVMLDNAGHVVTQMDTTTGEDTFLESVINAFVYGEAEQLVIEDLPHGVDYRGLVKRVCQIQGRFVERMYGLSRVDQLLFVAPNTWRRKYSPLRVRGAGMDAVVPVAAEIGYTPPKLQHLSGPRGGKAIVNKVQTDYCAAFLIAYWALGISVENNGWDVPGTERYGGRTKLKHADELKDDE